MGFSASAPAEATQFKFSSKRVEQKFYLVDFIGREWNYVQGKKSPLLSLCIDVSIHCYVSLHCCLSNWLFVIKNIYNDVMRYLCLITKLMYKQVIRLKENGSNKHSKSINAQKANYTYFKTRGLLVYSFLRKK